MTRMGSNVVTRRRVAIAFGGLCLGLAVAGCLTAATTDAYGKAAGEVGDVETEVQYLPDGTADRVKTHIDEIRTRKTMNK